MFNSSVSLDIRRGTFVTWCVLTMSSTCETVYTHTFQALLSSFTTFVCKHPVLRAIEQHRPNIAIYKALTRNQYLSKSYNFPDSFYPYSYFSWRLIQSIERPKYLNLETRKLIYLLFTLNIVFSFLIESTFL